MRLSPASHAAHLQRAGRGSEEEHSLTVFRGQGTEEGSTRQRSMELQLKDTTDDFILWFLVFFFTTQRCQVCTSVLLSEL